jgi:hypothetical protein
MNTRSGSIGERISVSECFHWIDWMVYYIGLERMSANRLAYATPEHAKDFKQASFYFAEWRVWRTEP